ncbi:MAG: leucine-rich repeat protein [Lentisphaeria bacterium]|nr:leucine-rich repeat protein [Lentisphaeria bacterium]
MDNLDDQETIPGKGFTMASPEEHSNPFFDEDAQTIPPRMEKGIHADRLQPGDLICQQYEVLSEIGIGGMGIVYECLDKIAEKKIALKTILPELAQNDYEMGLTKRNFKLVSKLHHPHIANYNALAFDAGRNAYYLIMEFVHGQDIRKFLEPKREDGSLLKCVQHLILQAADALDYAHKFLIHRDIKPSNLMVDTEGNLKLLDFGLAAEIHLTKTTVNNRTKNTEPCGTLMYMSPEQLAGNKEKPGMDQYSLAATFYELISGRHLFNVKGEEALFHCIKNEVPERLEGVPACVADAFAKALSKNPADRFKNCRAFAEALNNSGTLSTELPQGKPLSTEERIQWYELLEELTPDFSAKPPETKAFQKTYNSLKQDFEKYQDAKPDTALLQMMKHIRESLGALKQSMKEAAETDQLFAEIQKLKEEAAAWNIVPGNTQLKLERQAKNASDKHDYSVAAHFLGKLKEHIQNDLKAVKDAQVKAEYEARKKSEEIAKQKAEYEKKQKEAWAKAANVATFSKDKKSLLKLRKTVDTFIIPDGVTSIEKQACENCAKLKSIVIPEGVTDIGNSAFNGCSGLTDLILPESLSSIGFSAFNGCSNLQKLEIPKNVKTIGKRAFNGCSSLTSVTIPESLTSIDKYVFKDCIQLKEIAIPSSVVSIEESAFKDCLALTSVSLPDSVTSIGPFAFSHCPKLTGIKLPKGITKISDWTFKESGLIEIEIPEGVTSIGEKAFARCRKLQSVTIPESVDLIGPEAFELCNKLKMQNLKLPPRTTVTSNAFPPHIHYKNPVVEPSYLWMTALSSPSAEDPEELEPEELEPVSNGSSQEVPAGSEDPDLIKARSLGVVFNEKGTVLISCPEHVRSLKIPAGVQKIKEKAFLFCKQLTSVTFPDSLIYIGNNAFFGCRKLSAVEFPENLKSIGVYAFYECINLSDLQFPEKLKSIGSYAFYGCKKLSNVALPDSVTEIGEAAFSKCSNLKRLAIGIGTTIIQSNTFSGCTRLKNVILPANLKKIGDSAFTNCSDLSEITLPYGLKTLGKSAFEGCCKILRIEIPDTVNQIGETVFHVQTKVVYTGKYWYRNYTGAFWFFGIVLLIILFFSC